MLSYSRHQRQTRSTTSNRGSAAPTIIESGGYGSSVGFTTALQSGHSTTICRLPSVVSSAIRRYAAGTTASQCGHRPRNEWSAAIAIKSLTSTLVKGPKRRGTGATEACDTTVQQGSIQCYNSYGQNPHRTTVNLKRSYLCRKLVSLINQGRRGLNGLYIRTTNHRLENREVNDISQIQDYQCFSYR